MRIHERLRRDTLAEFTERICSGETAKCQHYIHIGLQIGGAGV